MSFNYKIIIDCMVLAVIYATVFYRKWRAKGKRTLVVNTLMYLYCSLVFWDTCYI